MLIVGHKLVLIVGQGAGKLFDKMIVILARRTASITRLSINGHHAACSWCWSEEGRCVSYSDYSRRSYNTLWDRRIALSYSKKVPNLDFISSDLDL
jgi:hypothetical protein